MSGLGLVRQPLSRADEPEQRMEEDMKYRVYEDNAGGLTLFVYGDGGHVIYAHSGYEHSPGQLRADLAELDEGSSPDSWDGDEPDLDESDYTEESRRNGGWQIVAENGSRTPWGVASTKEFGKGE